MSELSELEKLDIENREQEETAVEITEPSGYVATETAAAAGAEDVAEPAEVSESEVAETPAETSEAVESAEGEAQEEAAPPAFDADAYLEQLAEAKRSITAGIVIYKGRINEKLQERTPEGYNALTSIINEPQYDRISQYDAELAAFSRQMENRMRLSRNVRMIALFVLIVVGIRLFGFDALASILPIAFPTIVIRALQIIDIRRSSVSEGSDKS